MAKFILSKKKVYEKYDEMKEVSDIVSYSYKTNEDVGEVLQDSDSYFSLNSYNTYKDLLDKVENRRIIYFLQGDNDEQIRDLVQNIKWFVVDNMNDFENLIEIVKEEDKKINLLIRMKFKEHTVYTGKYFVYGINWSKANDLIKEIKDEDYLDKLGVHFHRKTQNIGEWYLKDDLSDALSDESLETIDFVNIGGGVPSKYVNSKPKIEYIFKKIKEFKEFLNDRDIELMIEPGRFISAPSVRLKANVINVYRGNVIVDCSIFNAYMDTYLMHMRLPLLNEDKEGEFQYLIKGCSPDSLDIFRYKVRFDKEIKEGDTVTFKNAGAYNFHTEFGNLDKVPTKVVDSFE